jgi:hypothetical protein
MLTNGNIVKCKHEYLLRGIQNMMLTTWNITSRTPQGFCHMKYTNFCNEENRAKL